MDIEQAFETDRRGDGVTYRIFHDSKKSRKSAFLLVS